MRPLVMIFVCLAQLCAADYRIFWVDIWHPGLRTQAEAETMLSAAVQAKANAVFIQVRGEGHAYFLKRIEPLPQPGWKYQPGFDAISYITDRGHTMGLEVHAWMDLAPLWNSDRGYNPASPDHKWNQHGQHINGSELWITSTESSNHMTGMVDFGHPGATKHVTDVTVDVLRHYSLDGLHLDYARYPYAVDLSDDEMWNPEFFGWNPTSIERFNRLKGMSGRPKQSNSSWQDWRRAQITNVVRQIYLRAKEIRPSVKVSAAVAVWGTPPSAGENFHRSEPYQVGFQDWHGWLQEGIVDFVVPMLYRKEGVASSKAEFDGWLNWLAQHKHGREIAPGLGNYMNTVPGTMAQLDRVLAHPGNFLGVGLFSYASTNNESVPNARFYQMLGAHFSTPAQPSSNPMTVSGGHVLGQLTPSSGPLSRVDGVTAEIRRGSDHSVVKRTTTDGTGFFGFVGISPGDYYVVFLNSGEEILRTKEQAVLEGSTTRFDGVLYEGCTYAILPSTVIVPASGGVVTITVSASAPTCTWTAGSGLSWGVSLNGATARTGSATLEYIFQPNIQDDRSDYVSIAGTDVPFSQPATLTPDNQTPSNQTSEPILEPSLPILGELSPNKGTGSKATFKATFSHPRGVGHLYLGYLLFLPTPNIVSYSAESSCLIEYNRISNGMRLIDDPGTGWLGPLSGVVLSERAGSLTNSQCTIDLSAASASISGDTMTVTVPVTFRKNLTAKVASFLQALDVDGKWTDMRQFGDWMPSAGVSRPGPSTASVTSSTVAGSEAQYTITAGHTSGASSLGMIHLLIGTGIVAANPCHVVYFPGSKQLNLVNDTGSSLVLNVGRLIGSSSGAIANSRCSIDVSRSSQSVLGNSLRITLSLSFQTNRFHGSKSVYVNTFDTAGRLTHWEQVASLYVQ